MIEVRKAREEDIPNCVEICHVSEFMEPGNYYPDEDYFVEYLNKIFFVAVKDGDVLGLIIGAKETNDDAYLDILAVKESERRNGIGTELLDYFKDRLFNLGISYFSLYAPVKSESGINFFRKAGLREGHKFINFGMDI